MVLGSQQGFNLGNAHGKVTLTTNAAEAMKQAQREVQTGIRGIGASLQSIGGSISGFGGSLTAWTAPITAIGVAGLKVAGDFQASMNEIAARTGLTGEALERVRQQSLDLGAATEFSAQQSSDAFLQLLTAGLDVEQAMATLPNVLTAATASGEDLGLMADQVTNVMSAFQLQAEDTTGIVEAMARAAASSPASMGQMGDAMSQAGGIAKSFGLDVEDTAGLFAIFARQGIRGSEAATQLRSMLVAMTAQTEQTQGAWSELGTSMFDAEGNMRNFDDVLGDIRNGLDGVADEDRNRIIKQLAGSYGLVGFEALLASDGIESMKRTMDAQQSATDVAAQKMGGFNGSITSLMGSVETLMIHALTPLMENVLTPLIQQLITVVNGIAAWAQANPELTTAITGFLGALVAIGPILFIAGKAITLIGAVLGAIASPIALVIAGIVALGVAIATNFGGIRDLLQPVIDWFMVGFGQVVGFIQGTIIPGLQTLANWFVTDALPAIISFIQTTVIPAIQTFVGILANIWNDVSPFLQALFDWFWTTGLPLIVDFVQVVVIPAIQAFVGILASIWEAVSPALASIYDWFITTGLPKIKEFVEGPFTVALTGIRDFLAGLWTFLQPHIDAFKNGIKTAFDFIRLNVLQPVLDMLTKIIDTVSAATASLGQIGSGVGAVLSATPEQRANVDVFGAIKYGLGIRDNGGPGLAGNPYLIGKGAQPEVFIPETNGQFIPNFDQMLQQMGSGSGEVNIYGGINVSGVNSYEAGLKAGQGVSDGVKDRLRSKGLR